MIERWNEMGSSIMVEAVNGVQQVTIDGQEFTCAGILYQDLTTPPPWAVWCKEEDPPLMLDEVLFIEAEKWHQIDINPKAALLKQMRTHGFVPTSDEFDLEYEGQLYKAQESQHPVTGEVRVYYAKFEQWGDVRYAG